MCICATLSPVFGHVNYTTKSGAPIRGHPYAKYSILSCPSQYAAPQKSNATFGRFVPSAVRYMSAIIGVSSSKWEKADFNVAGDIFFPAKT